jgi:hypothetical protein
MDSPASRSVRARILDTPPISGSVPEYWHDAWGDCVWVHFDAADGREWAGAFGATGVTGSTVVALFGGDRSAFVIARGQGYIIDTGSRELRHRTECESLVDVLALPGRDLVAACDSWNLFVYAPAGLVWKSERIAVDGIRMEAAGPAELAGSCDVGDRRSFRLDLTTWGFLEGPWEEWKSL